MINDKKLFPPYLLQEKCCGYLLESPHWGDSNKYHQHMFLGVLNTVFLNSSNYLAHLELRNLSIQIFVITNFVVISNVGIKKFDCEILFPEDEAADNDMQLRFFFFFYLLYKVSLVLLQLTVGLATRMDIVQIRAPAMVTIVTSKVFYPIRTPSPTDSVRSVSPCDPEYELEYPGATELLVSNLDYNISPREWKHILLTTFHPHVKVRK